MAGGEVPETRYVAVGDADVAYQVIGDGPPDLLYCYGLGSHIEWWWEIPASAEIFVRLSSFSRLIVFDRRGTGASDGVPRNAIPTWEQWAEDMGAVLDAAGSTKAAIMATLDAGPMAILFAAMHPERVSALVLLNTAARYQIADDYPVGATPEAIDTIVELIVSTWASPDFLRTLSPDGANDPEYVRLTGKMVRSSATPRSVAAQYDYILRRVDVRQALPLLQVPTLVLHVRDSFFVPLAHGQYLADHIDGAKFIELPGRATSPDGEHTDMMIDEIAEFLTGTRPEVEIERVLTTVLFTDIVGSTSRAASLGDQRWHTLLDAHDRTVREQLRRFRGKEINTTGDGFVASFDGPARAIRCGRAIGEATTKLGVDLRVGLHTGECEVRGDDLGGLAVHIAARIAALAGPGEVLVSETVKGLIVGSGLSLSERGTYMLKGVPDEWRLFAVEG
ncbi:MAG: adenylate/guanylate cyclase domain-containing protein [Acidimicrobiia bacterium]|nr:adenylate/guanylate cyclase domain-containing protein [Acidimicrobiia bacterium]